MVRCRHDIATEVQPFLIIARQSQNRPVAAENHPVCAEQLQNGFGIGPHCFRSLIAALGQEAGELAMDIGKSRQSAHILAPGAVVAGRNQRLGTMVDDNRQLRVTPGKREEMRQIGRQDQRIERQAVVHQRRHGGIEQRIIDPCHVFHALQHRAHGFERPMFCPAGDFRCSIGRLHVHPADHTFDEICFFRQRQHEIRISSRLHRLNQHGAGNSGRGQQWR